MVRFVLSVLLASAASAEEADETSSLLSVRSELKKSEQPPGGYAIPGVDNEGEEAAPCDDYYSYYTDETEPLPLKEPPSENCPQPKNAKVCHFWGDPHFTHLFTSIDAQHALNERMVVAFRGGREGHVCKDTVHGIKCLPNAANPPKVSYVGCYADDGNRDLFDGPKQYGYTVDSCAAACSSYKFFALQNNGWCVCGNKYASEPQYKKVNNKQCGGGCQAETNKDCDSAPCGGAWRNAVYKIEEQAPLQKDEKFTVELVGSDTVALKGGRAGKYCADEDHNGRIICNRDWLKSWETFKVVDLGGGRLAFRGGRHNHQYTCADEGSKTVCNREWIRGWEKFAFQVVNAGQDIKELGAGVIHSSKKGKERHHTIVDWHGQGVFNLASSKDGNVQVQEFFCDAFRHTTTGVATAMKFGNDIVQVVRGIETAPTSDDPKAKTYHMKTSSDETYTKFYINGEQVDYADLGEAASLFSHDVKDVGGGETIGQSGAFMQQMHTNDNHNTLMPVCVGDAKNIVEIAVRKDNTDHGQRVYHQGFTVRMSKPGDGLCAEDWDTMHKNGENHRVKDKKEIMFSSRQMRDLCKMCRLDDDDGACGAPEPPAMSVALICRAAGHDYAAAKEECGDMEGHAWQEACILETCTQGPGAHGVAALEANIAADHSFKD